MKRPSRAVAAALLAALALVSTPEVGQAHPLHTTFVELTFAPKTGIATAMVKVFADDFTQRVTRGSSAKPGDEAILQKLSLAYLSRTLVANAATGEAIQWRFCGWKRSADLIFICLSAPVRRGLSGVRIRDTILSDVFGDQVNVLQAEYGGRRHSILFTGASGAKQLP